MKKRYKILFLLVIVTLTCFIFCKMFYPERPHLTVIGCVTMADGIGRQAVDLMNAVYDEVSFGFIPCRISDLTDVPLRIQPFIKKPNKNMGKVVVYESALPRPNQKFDKRLRKFIKGPKNKNQIRIAYSMLESSRIPAKWVEALNKCFDAVAVPDEFLVDVYTASGVSIPIFVLPLGLDMDSFLTHPLKTERNKPFCFMNVSTMIPRKNHEGLIRAFYQAFGDNPDVELRLNYRYGKQQTLVEIESLIDSLKVHNIVLTGDQLDNHHYLEFLSKGDVLVTLSKGEGFSIQPREAMALGLPVILSDNTAHKTVINSTLCSGISCPHADIAYNAYLSCECGEEYIADIDEAALAMRHVYENYEKYLESAWQRREWAARYRFENLKPFYLTLIQPRQITLGDHNEITENCLITSSPELYNKYQQLLFQPSSLTTSE